MNATSSYKKDYKVRTEHVDFKGKLKLSSLFTYFQDISGLHSEELGMGMELLYEKHSVLWVLARIRVDVNRYPSWNDDITIETWPQKPSRMGFERDFLVRDQKGNILAKSISSWVVIDVKTRRLKPTKDIFIGYLPIIEERAIDCRLGGLKPQGPLELVSRRRVGYSDIDINRHLNNSKYVDFIMDSFGLEEHEKYHIKSIEVNYSKEALPGDTMAIYKDLSQHSSGLIYMEGKNEKDDSLTFKSKIEIESI